MSILPSASAGQDVGATCATGRWIDLDLQPVPAEDLGRASAPVRRQEWDAHVLSSVDPQGQPTRTAAPSSPRARLQRDASEPTDEGAPWAVVGSIAARVHLRAGERYVVRFDPGARRLEELRPDDRLTPMAHAAVDRAPRWLADRLADRLGHLSAGEQDVFGGLVVEAEDPFVDEIAFQIAHLGTGPLTDPRFDAGLLAESARLIYEHDRLLRYVDVVDYGSAAEGGDYYSTTRYRVKSPADPGFSRWVEVPRDVYYWYVVHPKISDETVKRSTEADQRQATYGHFWRSYLFANPDPAHDYTRAGGGRPPYPVLGEVLREPTLLWDGVSVDRAGGRPFETGDVALDVVGNWVSTVLPQKASGNRPVQPNQIAYEHNGNCGEIQDLLGAASRTALIPNVLTTNHCEDHVWNEVFAFGPEPLWLPFQVDWAQGPTRIGNYGVAYDKDKGGGKDVSGIWAWRPDGFAYDVVDRYSKAASLRIRVVDSGEKPVDGARVLVFSEAWSGEGYSLATFGHTDARGVVAFRVGDQQNYYLQVTSSLGRYPPEANRIVQVVEAAEADALYEHEARLDGALRRYADWIQGAEDDAYRLDVRFEATDEVVVGSSPFGTDLDFTDWRQPGQVDFLVYDERNFAIYDAGTPATAQYASENAPAGELSLPAPEGPSGKYVVLSNEDHVANGQVVRVEVTLYRDAERTTPSLFLPAAGSRAREASGRSARK